MATFHIFPCLFYNNPDMPKCTFKQFLVAVIVPLVRTRPFLKCLQWKRSTVLVQGQKRVSAEAKMRLQRSVSQMEWVIFIG